MQKKFFWALLNSVGFSQLSLPAQRPNLISQNIQAKLLIGPQNMHELIKYGQKKYTIITLKYKKVYFVKFGYFKAVFGKKYARIHTEDTCGIHGFFKEVCCQKNILIFSSKSSEAVLAFKEPQRPNMTSPIALSCPITLSTNFWCLQFGY